VVEVKNPSIFAYVRSSPEEEVLVVNNLSRFAQPAAISLSRWAGKTPVELVGGVPFPPLEEQPYRLSMGPHGFYWFRLEDGV
jgi:maltose alpha-D-glucosyltransferase/alpha-amylase